MKNLKEAVIRSFLSFLSKFVALKDAQVATLGGQGVEAKIWAEQEIPASHGWLIERRPSMDRKLIERYYYRTQNQLSTFSKILQGYGQDQAYVDGFHLDLCGTLNKEIVNDLVSILSLVFNSRGRCLAITVADQRRNLVHEQWPSIHFSDNGIFGSEGKTIYNALYAMQSKVPLADVKKLPKFIRRLIKPRDPHKAAQREFGLLCQFADLLVDFALPHVPTAIERYIYVSKYAGRSFRMRSYFFHFDPWNVHRPIEVEKLAVMLAKRWVESKLFFAHDDKGFQEIGAQTVDVKIKKQTEKPKKEKMKKNQLAALLVETDGHEGQSRLGNLARALGGEEEAQYNRLVADSKKLAAVLKAIDAATNGVVGASDVSAQAQGKEGPKKVGPKVIPEHPTLGLKKKRVWKDFTEREQMEWLLKACELKHRSGGHWKDGQWEQLLTDTFGHYDNKLGSSLRCVFARANGGFRESFKSRIRAAFGEEAGPYLERVAKLP